MSTRNAPAATTTTNKKRRAGQDLADVDHTKETELNYWRERLTKMLAMNGARTLGSVVDLPKLFPDWTIAGVRNVDVVLRLMMAVYKDKGPPMSFEVYQTLRASYSAVCRYALALSSVTASDTMSSAAAATEAPAAAAATEAVKKAKGGERYSRVALLRDIARELVPAVRGDDEVILDGEELRRVDRAFLAWPVRYATPSSIYYTPADEEDDSLASIGFWWDSPHFVDAEIVTFDIQHDDDDTYTFIAQDEKDEALLQRVDEGEE
jgi:hypothetical protein